ncbi:hypothetical protein C0Q70_11982 [Pomacea canaliculata]|uniref:Uncharacterized protein n=1 Tax=Pomacea canaliculata TaxID=400727 RepID=A0A2T7P095_POMCA|nr:hypothetical protein C0Q70_11982 [Pomacea canaliculata]
MRGRGLGSLLSSVGRMILPLVKRGGKALLKEGLHTGVQIAQDVMSGQNFKTAMQERGKEAGKRLFNQAVSAISGSGAPPGEPARKRIKPTSYRRRVQKKKKKTTTSSTADIFD